MGKELAASHYTAVQQLRFRCAASATAHFHARLEKTSPSVQCVSRGHSPYENAAKHNSLCERALGGKNWWRPTTPQCTTSIPLRCISVAGIRPMKKQSSTSSYVSKLPTRMYLVVFSHCSLRARKFLLPNGGF